MHETFASYCDSPIGLLKVSASENAVARIDFIDNNEREEVIPNKYTQSCIVQLDEYFNGVRKEFNIPLLPEGTTFQQKVWGELLKIPFGKTASYIQMAMRLGDKKAVRAVGTANGSNPVAIIVPCHRVIGNDGKLVGYAGGLWRKKWLLEHEEKIQGERLF